MTYTQGGNERIWKTLDTTHVHINASNKDAAFERFDKQHPNLEEEAIREGFIYTFDIRTDNLKKEKPDESSAKQKAKSGNAKGTKRNKVPNARSNKRAK